MEFGTVRSQQNLNFGAYDQMWIHFEEISNWWEQPGCVFSVTNEANYDKFCSFKFIWLLLCNAISIFLAGERPLPAARLEELMYILNQLAGLVIHSDTVSVLPLHPFLKSGLVEENNSGRRPHLLVLFPSFCELVISR